MAVRLNAAVRGANHADLTQLNMLNDGNLKLGKYSSSARQCRRMVYLDLGANWANTLRLHHSLKHWLNNSQAQMPRQRSACWYDWEIYSFEPSPVMQPYLDAYATYLTGKGTKPTLTVPPIGGSLQMLPYAKKFGCPSAHDHTQYKSMYACMNRVFADAYRKLQIDARLNDTLLLQARLDEASIPNFGVAGSRSRHGDRYTFLPAGVSDRAGSIDVSWPSGLFLQTGPEAALGAPPPIARPSHIPEHMSAPMVDIPAWLKQHFKSTDIIVVKMDVEGAEHGILRKMAEDGTLSWISVLG